MSFGVCGNEKYLVDIGECTRSWRYRALRLGFFLFCGYKIVHNIAVDNIVCEGRGRHQSLEIG